MVRHRRRAAPVEQEAALPAGPVHSSAYRQDRVADHHRDVLLEPDDVHDESLLIARVHPMMSVVTLMATGLLCYAGHVCNYYVKVLEWNRGLPAVLRDNQSFLIKRRKSIRAAATDTRQKKPTTANWRRLEAGIREAKQRLPDVYKDSIDLPEELAKKQVV